jgi:hypothetical protein
MRNDSRQGPRASFEARRREDGKGTWLRDTSTDEDGVIVSRLWVTSDGRRSRAKRWLLKGSGEVEVLLVVADDHLNTASTKDTVTLA